MADPTLVDRPPSGEGWLHEVKWDGYRLQAHLDADGVHLFTRKGNDWTAKFEPIAVAVAALPARQLILDGEVVAIGENGVSDFHELRRQIGAPSQRLTYQVFDLLWLDGEDFRPLPLGRRKARLKALLDGAGDPLAFVDGIEAEGRAVLQGACRLQLEGIVSKRREAPYRAGRSNDWLKAKCTVSETFAVVGYSRDDNGRIEGLYLGRATDEGQWAYAGQVESGLDADALARLERELPPTKVVRAPLVAKPRGKSGATWTRPELLVEIEYPNKADDGRIRHPRFKGFRDDIAEKARRPRARMRRRK